ncbi:LOW QUALITY PROTEIN: helicase SKI2W-like [Gigantopelta aegis]|uniref:LOW QUALITY PROTEIN: helicase SKI2W-like n=1 Tax=Gigantopelta aegis TaxID=1735272 RepID=UPI001B88C6B4|nr:LOW QUALITY PROTEIN: helicase SKI2W-like [Gigantopelta aegis]
MKMDSEHLDLNFDLLETGCHGGVEVVPVQNIQSHHLPLKTLPCGLPPVLPSIGDELETFLTCLEELPVHNFKNAQRFWPRKMCPDRILSLDTCPVQTTIEVERNATTGKLLGYKEEYVTDEGQSEKNSLSLKRSPGPVSQSVWGNAGSYPFWPGGLDEPEMKLDQDGSGLIEFDLENNLQTVAPGLASGMTFKKKMSGSEVDKPDYVAETTTTVINLQDIMADTDDIDFPASDIEDEEVTENKERVEESQINELEGLDNLVLTNEKPVEKTALRGKCEAEEWAVKVDVNEPVDDFYKRIPHMAYKWPFELDIFQKQAILHLESHESVFVSAHTSAGKTVVAEYAIALSLKHMTRTIYTSPIKALSNQKFRDFKQTFGDVGLVTGDVQLNQTAACLIMTTEILRSMLYNGSDVIRDLEWVIFDEVHYINDSERGVVWEEVLIMLPQHVNIILLSATVPNTMEFAGWVGRTKRKKIFVVSTSKRPVPLEHHLYTGNSMKTNSEMFVIVDSKGNFITNGYKKALDAKKERSSKRDQSYGPKGTRGGNPAQDKNVWLSLIDMLKKKDKLPVVAFTFSKKKIEENAANLLSVDLLTASEKSEVHIFFHKCIHRLRGNDKHLPQIVQMEDHLKRGLGVHHSGILPILKEVVEMMFQRGLVKVLFATETFAMGVNMPARTVVFDSIRKHDGTNFRDLLPGEYIQMAGRAGRRGLDTTGTVIILCKGDVPEMSNLHKMMLGKPTKLESQFRLTYTMILNLLRVEQLRVQDMMKRSFSEFHTQKDVQKHRDALTQITKEVSELRDIECYMCSVDLHNYYDSCKEYHELKQHLQTVVLSHPAAMKALSPGRIVIINDSHQRRVLGVVLQASAGSSGEKKFIVLVVGENNVNDSVQMKTRCVDSEINKQYVDSEGPEPVLPTQLFVPDGPITQMLLTLMPRDISVITTKTIKVEPEKIVNDIKKRQQARFKDDPPGQSVSIATQELMRLTEANPSGLPGLDPVKDLRVRDISLVEQFRALQLMEEVFSKYQCIHCPNFDDHFCEIRKNMQLRANYHHLQHLLSDESLVLLPEYEQRVEVLKKLNYLDQNNAVQLKGRVACEISTHELIITELVFENVLTGLHPADIAALLSCMVFEQKRCSEPNLADNLEKGKESILEVAERIGKLQKECGMSMPVEDFKALFHFNLMEVVFEWARGMPFAEITNLTDVQEGIIVRCIQRLNETLRDVRNAARIIGDPVLYQKMEEASTMIKRDIVFAASLYTQ